MGLFKKMIIGLASIGIIGYLFEKNEQERRGYKIPRVVEIAGEPTFHHFNGGWKPTYTLVVPSNDPTRMDTLGPFYLKPKPSRNSDRLVVSLKYPYTQWTCYYCGERIGSAQNLSGNPKICTGVKDPTSSDYQ